MNIYARIRKIEEPDAFKRFFNCVMGASYPNDFEPTKEWHDFGLDGYLKSRKSAYAVYCPKYPERVKQEQYNEKIRDDAKKLCAALKDKKISYEINEWCFVTPDDLTVKVQNFIKEEAKKCGWSGTALTALSLAPLFMEHNKIHKDFPEITAGLQFDKVPMVYVKCVDNRGYRHLELFNNGTEAIQDLKVEIKSDGAWTVASQFYYDYDNPVTARIHTCVSLRQGERQMVSDVPQRRGFSYRISGVGVEPGSSFVEEGDIARLC